MSWPASLPSVHRLLEFQRPRVGRPSAQNIAGLLQDVLALSGKQLQQAGVTVDYDLDQDLPPVLVVGDQLKQVFLNLILNAVEAMPGGGRLFIRGYCLDDDVVVTFGDTGPGIAPEDMGQMFEPFFSTKHSGSGLGLAVSQEIVSNHGGVLSAANQPEGGALFSLTLPALPESEAVPVT